MTELIPSELKVTDLRKELLARNLPTTGLKKDLVERLEEALKVSNDSPSPAKDDSDQIDVYPPSELEKNADSGAADGKREGSSDRMETESVGLKRKSSHDGSSDVGDMGIDMAVDASLDPADKEPEEEGKATNGEGKEAAGSMSSDAVGAQVSAAGLMDSLYVKNLERPLTVYRFEEFLGKHGAVKKAWLNSIKTRGYARFDTEQGAKAVFDAVNGAKFPPEHGRVLECGLITAKRMAELICDEEAMSETVRDNDLVAVAIEGENCGVKLVNVAAKNKNANKKQKTEKKHDAGAEKGSAAAKATKAAERSAAIVAAAANAAAQEARDQGKDGGDKVVKQPTKTKRDSFASKTKHDSFALKTKFEPPIMYRPLTDEEVAAKKASAGTA